MDMKRLHHGHSDLGGDFFLVGGVQHFNQAVFQLEALVQQLPQLVEFLGHDRSVRAITLVAAIIERQRKLGDDIETGIDRVSQLEPAFVVESPGCS